MEKISFEVVASDATIKPDDYKNVRVEVDGVKVSDLLESVEDNELFINEIGGEAIAEYFSNEGRLFEFLSNFDCGELADFLESRGWKIKQGDD